MAQPAQASTTLSTNEETQTEISKKSETSPVDADLEAAATSRRQYGIDPKREKSILRRMDIHLLPFVSLLYLLSFL